MANVSIGKLKELQDASAREFRVDDSMKMQDVRYVAGFDVSYKGDTCIAAAVVFDLQTMRVVEKKYAITKAPVQYIPGLLAFREGPPICQTYYDLETEPDVLMIDGHGIADVKRCGLATFVGVELGKPSIGVAKNLSAGIEHGNDIVIDNEIVGAVLRTKEHAKPLFVSSGYLVPLSIAVELVKKTVIPPHKLPEPIHAAHRFADKIVDINLSKKMTEKEEVIET